MPKRAPRRARTSSRTSSSHASQLARDDQHLGVERVLGEPGVRRREPARRARRDDEPTSARRAGAGRVAGRSPRRLCCEPCSPPPPLIARRADDCKPARQPLRRGTLRDGRQRRGVRSIGPAPATRGRMKSARISTEVASDAERVRHRVRHRAHAAERAARLARLVHVGGAQVVERQRLDRPAAPGHLTAVLRAAVGIDVEVLEAAETLPRPAGSRRPASRPRAAGRTPCPGKSSCRREQLGEVLAADRDPPRPVVQQREPELEVEGREQLAELARSAASCPR